MFMKAGVLYGKEDLRYEDVPTPSLASGDVLVKVKYTGICGSDIPRVNGEAARYYPIILGHEFSGVVDKVGSKVKNLKVGDRVAGAPLLPCKECVDCRNGDYALCKQYSFVGSRQAGSFAEYVTIPEENAIKFDNSISFEQGAFFEPMTIALHGINRVDFKPGSTVAIIGGGNIGLFTTQWARILGAEKIVVFDVDNDRLNLLKHYGATEGVNVTQEDFYNTALQYTNHRGFDYVFETAGSTETIKYCFDLVANKGSVCLIGTPNQKISFEISEWEQINRKEFNLTGSWMSYSAPFPGKEWELTAHYVNNGELQFDDSFIYHKIGLSEIDAAFKMFKEPGRVKGKILIDSER